MFSTITDGVSRVYPISARDYDSSGTRFNLSVTEQYIIGQIYWTF